LHSRISALLEDLVKIPDGLQFIVFIPAPQCEQTFSGKCPQAANLESIETLIHLHGLHNLDHTAGQQIEAWLQCIAPTHEFFNKLSDLQPMESGGTPTSLARAVFDVEAGGLFWGTVGNSGWVFAATLDQQPLNSGSAERHLVAAVKAIKGALKKSGG
jgi:hypothetical protein